MVADVSLGVEIVKNNNKFRKNIFRNILNPLSLKSQNG